jgi:hypothetical protein
MKVAATAQFERNAGRSRRFRQSNAEHTFFWMIIAPTILTSFVYSISFNDFSINHATTVFSSLSPHSDIA